jgi:hypothetical protein
MKIGHVQSLLHDLIEFENYKNPLNYIWIKKKIEFNMLTGEFSGDDNDSFKELYEFKRRWFLKRLKKLNGKLKDFKKIRFIVFGAREKITIKYKDKSFENEKVYGEWLDKKMELKK